MSKKVIMFVFASFILFLGACTSDKEKAEAFVKSLDKSEEILLILPVSSPDCVFYTKDNVIMSYNVKNDSTNTIPYGDVIDEDDVTNILAGDKNIIVITNNKKKDVEQVFLYDVAKHKFSEIKPFEFVTEIKLSKSNKTIAFTDDESNEIALSPDWWSEYEANKYDEKYLNKTVYNVVTKYYNYDGKLVKTKNTPVSVKEYAEKIEEAEEDAGDYNNYNGSGSYNDESSSASSYPAVYRWTCSKCGEVRESVDRPDPFGCPWNGHMWDRQERVR